jgi:hypothetical protein
VTALAVAATLLDPVDGEPTLDEVIVSAWEGLTAHRPVECPVCRGEMEPECSAQGAASSIGRRAGHAPEGGRCTSCGARLA